MTGKELKKLSRAELLRLLLLQTKETEQAHRELEEVRRLLSERHLRMEKAGNLAQAVLDINGVAAAAQAAADQYLENIAAMERETRERCARMLQKAEAEAAQLLQRAKTEAEELLDGAHREAAREQVDDELMAELHQLLGE